MGNRCAGPGALAACSTTSLGFRPLYLGVSHGVSRTVFTGASALANKKGRLQSL